MVTSIKKNIKFKKGVVVTIIVDIKSKRCVNGIIYNGVIGRSFPDEIYPLIIKQR